MIDTDSRQPWLHDRQIAVYGNATAVSGADGSMGEPGTGLMVDDRLVMQHWAGLLDGESVGIIARTSSGATTSLWGCARNLGDPGPDPTVEVHIERQVIESGMRETTTLVSRSVHPVEATMHLHLGGASAELTDVKHGHLPVRFPPIEATPDGLHWRDERHRTTVRCDPPPDVRDIGAGPEGSAAGLASLAWRVRLTQGTPVVVCVQVSSTRESASLFDAGPGAPLVDWSGVRVAAADARLPRLVTAGVSDLRCLLLTDPDHPTDVFAAAGTPWYLTLFGRDSLWAARMMLPVDVGLAGGTLRALARRQGKQVDPDTAEEPGKILHEVRRTSFVDVEHGLELPPLYYGTVDATALWCVVLHDAWRAGLPQDEVRDLLPHLARAMEWNMGAADNPTGLLRYIDTSGHGLSNQGWKDSGDSMRLRDGTIAPAPIALVEAQAYAVEAARGAAELYDAFGLDGSGALRSWADLLTMQIRERYWVEDEDGPYLAMALGGDDAPVDGVGSNMGHVLGTGVLDPSEVDAVVRRLSSPDLLGEFGIGTLGRGNPAYNPIGYHTGSVWTHDCAVALLGMVREGRSRDGAAIARGLVDCAAALGYRAPELFAGASIAGLPAPYPASCRPQAWAAASAVAILTAVLGLSLDVPGRRLALSPMFPAPFGPIRVEGLRFGPARFTVDVDAHGEVGISGLPTDVAVLLHGEARIP